MGRWREYQHHIYKRVAGFVIMEVAANLYLEDAREALVTLGGVVKRKEIK
jgi:hypothetical protein